MRIDSFDSFSGFCAKRFCPRRTITNDKCDTDSKQSSCWEKFKVKEAKAKNKEIRRAPIRRTAIKKRYKKDMLAGIVREQVFERDPCCMIWQFLTESERRYILNNHAPDYFMLKDIHDPMHIDPKGSDQKGGKYDSQNIIRGSRYFHTLMEGHKNPVTQKFMSYEERTKFMKEARDGKRTIPSYV